MDCFYLFNYWLLISFTGVASGLSIPDIVLLVVGVAGDAGAVGSVGATKVFWTGLPDYIYANVFGIACRVEYNPILHKFEIKVLRDRFPEFLFLILTAFLLAQN